MKTLTKMAAWVGAAALVAVPSAHATPTHTTENLSPAAAVQSSGDDVADEMNINIVGGKKASIKDWPFMAKLRVHKNTDKIGNCGGFIVSSDIVITAEHCVDDGQDDDGNDIIEKIVVHYGDRNWKKGDTATTTLENVRMGDGRRAGDWAVLKFDAPLNVDPEDYLPMASHNWYDEGPMFRAAGWGRLSYEGKKTKYLREVDLPFVPDHLCGEGEADICAGDYENGGIDTCSGDSGGPLVRDVENIPVAVGITSFGKGCGRPEEVGKYTQISTYWPEILEAVEELDGEYPSAAPMVPVTK